MVIPWARKKKLLGGWATHLKNMSEFVNWDDMTFPPNIIGNIIQMATNPPTRKTHHQKEDPTFDQIIWSFPARHGATPCNSWMGYLFGKMPSINGFCSGKCHL